MKKNNYRPTETHTVLCAIMKIQRFYLGLFYVIMLWDNVYRMNDANDFMCARNDGKKFSEENF